MKFLGISLLIHLAIAFLLMYRKAETIKQVPRLTSNSVEQPKSFEPIKIKISVEPPKPQKSKKIVKYKEVVEELSCDSFYYGIGYTGSVYADDEGKCNVDKLTINAPLYRAGVIPGDIIEGVPGEICPGRGANGSSLSVTVRHQDTIRTILLQREKICEN
jgi:hypothetical protein